VESPRGCGHHGSAEDVAGDAEHHRHHAQADGLVKAGTGIATQKIGPASRLHIIDALLSGTHERGTSHYELLRAFASARTLEKMDNQLEFYRYTTHEFGDSILLERGPRPLSIPTPSASR